MGAEATIFEKENSILKVRQNKSYRNKELDNSIIKSRTKREAKILDKLQKINFSSPKLINFNENEIEMEKINGVQLKSVLIQNHIHFSKEIGKKIAILHDNEIIHGDLTTSNMIHNGNEIIFIDFGLSFQSNKDEDKAVDLHLLKQALESKHYEIFEECYEHAILEYKNNSKFSDSVLLKLQEVEKRGRNKLKGH